MDRLSRIDMLLELLKAEPDDVFLNYALGVEHMSELNLADAESQFRKVISLQPDYIPAYYQMGKLFESKLMNPEALGFYRQGLELARAKKDNKAVNEFSEAIFMLED
jgi:tetratricopeptide (TPR) repeat protein